MKKFLAMVTAAVLACGALFSPIATENLSLAAAAAQTTVAAPVPDREAGLHGIETDSLEIHLTTGTPNAVIYYKIDNGDYTKYNGAVNITKNCKLYTYAELNGTKSAVAEYEYKLAVKFNWSVSPGSYTENQVVKVTTNVPGAKLYYSMDGKQATESSKEMPANGVNIENTSFFSVLAAKEGWTSVGNVYTFDINKLNNSELGHYYYNQLSNKQKEVYDRVDKAIKNGITEIDVSDLNFPVNNDEFHIAMESFNKERCTDVAPDYDGHWYTAYGTDTKYTLIRINYSIKDPYMQAAQKKYDEAVAKIIEEAKKQPTAYEKLKYIHDWLVDNADYNTDVPWYSNYADAPIVKGEAICNSYARAFTYLARALGFDCFTIGGFLENGGGHAWNKVKLDGEWYNVDVTWDDFSYLGDNKIYYTYFLKNDEEFYKGRNIELGVFPASPAHDYDPVTANYDPTANAIKGDANGDGKVNSLDALTILRAMADGTHTALSLSADITGDGMINSADALAILRGLAAGTL